MHITFSQIRLWPGTLKFKIVVMVAATAVLSALVAAHMVLGTTQTAIEQQLLQAAGDERERTAALLAAKIDVLHAALRVTARQAGVPLWSDPSAMARYLIDKAAIESLFDSLFAANPDGRVLARLDRGLPIESPPGVAGRDYMTAATTAKGLVLSAGHRDPLTGAPTVVLAMPVKGSDGSRLGIVAGGVSLNDNGLFAQLRRDRSRHRAHDGKHDGKHDAKPDTKPGTDHDADDDGTRDMVIDASGQLLAHSDARRVLGMAADEPGLAPALALWRAASPSNGGVGTGAKTRANKASVVADHLVSQALIPGTAWRLVRMTPQSVALAPLTAARVSAWRVGALVGAVAAVLAGLLGWAMTRPITALRRRTETLLADADRPQPPWPSGRGEVGDLSRAFDHVVRQSQHRQLEVRALVQRLEAVLDHAEVGIALSRHSHFELVSQHFCDIFHCDRSDAIGQPTRSIYPSPEAYDVLSARARPAFTQYGAFDGELELMRRNGQTFWAHMRGRAVVPGDLSKGTIWIIEDVTAAREHREHLVWTASHDSLTGLANRKAFEELLARETALSSLTPFCALFIDLDRFKQVNDTGGHAAGDALLRGISEQLVAQVRRSDTVARLGGDEFAVLLSKCPLPRAQHIAEQLRAAVSNYRLSWEGLSHSVGASVGLVVVNGNYSDPVEVLKAADQACYEAKHGGRDRVAVHGSVEGQSDALDGAIEGTRDEALTSA